MNKALLFILFILPLAAQAERIAGGLYDHNGNLINANFSPADAKRAGKHKTTTVNPLAQPGQDFDKNPVRWQFGNKPPEAYAAEAQARAAAHPLNYRPLFNTQHHYWGEPGPPGSSAQYPWGPPHGYQVNDPNAPNGLRFPGLGQ